MIDAIRSEIATLWEKCFFSVEQRQAFAPYFSGGFTVLSHFTLNPNCHRSKTRRDSVFFLSVFLEDLTEELLSLHDAEVQRLQQHHEEHRELFDGVQQWEESWRLFLELEVS